MWDKIKTFFDNVEEKVQTGIAKVGGPVEKRNLLGVGLDFLWGCVKFPFKLVSGTVRFVKLLFTEPHQAWCVVAFNTARIGQTLLAMMRIERTPHRRGDGSTYYTYEGVGRALVVGYVIFIMWLGIPVAIDLGATGIAWFLFLGGPAVVILTGLGAMMRRFRTFKWETWFTLRQEAELAARTRGESEQQQAQNKLAQARQDAEWQTVEQERTQVQFHALTLQAAEAAKAAREEAERLALIEADLKAEGARTGIIRPEEDQSQIARLMGDGPQLGVLEEGMPRNRMVGKDN